MSLRQILVKVQRDPMTAIAAVIGAHELPILEVLHGEGSITVVDEAHGEIETPDPREEYARIGARYGVHPEYGMPLVEYVYGRTLDRLADALDAGGELPAPKPQPVPRARAAKLAGTAADA